MSHWEVNSDAAVKLITSAVAAMAHDDATGRSEALRRAMLAMIDTGKPHEAHPAHWAPFVVVGEGSPAPAPVTISPERSVVPPAQMIPPKAKSVSAHRRPAKPRRPDNQTPPHDWAETVFPR